MTYAIPSRLLRVALGIDAAASGALAILQIVAAGMTARLLGLSEGLLLGTGLFLAAYVVLLILLARSAAVPRVLVLLVAAGNVAWGVGCIALAATLRVDLTLLGSDYLLFQVVAVIAFAAAQALGLRQSSNTSRVNHQLASAKITL
jgi:hypothetical protein